MELNGVGNRIHRGAEDEVAVGEGVSDLGRFLLVGGNFERIEGEVEFFNGIRAESCGSDERGEGFAKLNRIFRADEGAPNGLRGSDSIDFEGEFAGEEIEQIVFETEAEGLFTGSNGGKGLGIEIEGFEFVENLRGVGE